jgi:hypothetical protein
LIVTFIAVFCRATVTVALRRNASRICFSNLGWKGQPLNAASRSTVQAVTVKVPILGGGGVGGRG